MTRLSVFIASSVDGYIATRDGGLEWLEDAARVGSDSDSDSDGDGDDYGYAAFLGTVDALAMGRGTYDHIAHLDPLPFGGRPLFVFTHRPPPPRDGVTFWDESPVGALARWTALGLRRVYVDGGNLIGGFLAEGLIDDMVLTTAPVLLGDGLALFPPGPRSRTLALVDTRSWPNGFVSRSYELRAASNG